MTSNKKKNIFKGALLFSVLLLSISFLNFGEKEQITGSKEELTTLSEAYKNMGPMIQHYFKVEQDACGKEELVPQYGAETRTELVVPDNGDDRFPQICPGRHCWGSGQRICCTTTTWPCYINCRERVDGE